MGLSDDQRAMLRLLAQRGEEGYDDVAALMGLSVEEVRAKVAEALAVVAEEGALAPSQPAAQEPSAPEPPAAPAPEPQAAPAPAPDPQPQQPAPAPPKAARPKRASTPPKISLPSGNGPRAAIAAAAIVLVAIVVVLILSGGSSSDSGTTSASGTTASETNSEAQGKPTSNNAEVTKAVLNPVAGGKGSGVAIFGRVKNSLALQIVAKELPPSTKGSTEYTVWLAQSPQRMLPLASTEVGADGRIGAQFKVPTEVLAYLANGTFDKLVLTKTSNSALEASLAEATKEERAPKYTGTEVLSGTVVGPIVGAAKRLEEEKEAEKGE